jgi:hypothetical protein
LDAKETSFCSPFLQSQSKIFRFEQRTRNCSFLIAIIEIRCGSLADLPTACGKLDAENRQMPSTVKHTGVRSEALSLSTGDRRLVRMPGLERLITAAALS